MKNQASSSVMAALLVAVSACQQDVAVKTPDVNTSSARAASATGTLLFQTDFDNSSIATATNPQFADIVGANIPGSEWTGTEVGNKFRLYFEGGTDAQRRVSATTDDGSTNKILKYQLFDTNVPALRKARIQADLYGFNNTTTGQPYKEIYQSVRMKLHYSSFNKILLDAARLRSGSGDWLTLFEFWNNNNWSDSYPLRVTVGLKKLEPARNKFVLYADAEDIDPATGNWRRTPLWESSVTNASNVVEIGQWVTVDIYFKEGSARTANGRFWLAVTPDGGTRKVICDVTNWTQAPTDPAPNGISQWNPMKLYTSEGIMNTVKASPNPQSLQVYWDNYRLWKDKQPQ
ncbi:MAG: hypothetical protein H7Z72_02100 [Bacteroidetes bacterium]|nr:hypothetical protein [Fibrella sp.]